MLVAGFKGLTALVGGAVVIMVIHLIVANGGKGGAGFIDVTGLQKPQLLDITGEPSGETISGQLSLFARGMQLALTHVGVAEFMRQDRQGSEISVHGGHLIAQPHFQINGVIPRAVGGGLDAGSWAGP